MRVGKLDRADRLSIIGMGTIATSRLDLEF